LRLQAAAIAEERSGLRRRFRYNVPFGDVGKGAKNMPGPATQKNVREAAQISCSL